MQQKAERHIISIIVENKPGVLARITSLFSARGFNIESLNVSEMETPELSRMTIMVTGPDQVIEQVRKQLSKLIDTLKVVDMLDTPCVESDLALIKIKATGSKRGEILNLANLFNARIADVSDRTIIAELSGDEDKLTSFLKLAEPYGIAEMVCAGRVVMKRGD